MSGGIAGQVGWVARRSIRRALRQPAIVFPTIVFPLVLLAVNAPGLEEATRLPGFPTDSYLDFAIAVCFLQGALFALTTSGTELAHDVETGFLSRLSLTPLRAVALLLGQVAGAVTVGLLGTALYITVGLIVGVSIAAGVGGVVVLFALSLLVCLCYAAIGAYMGLRTGSGEAVQGVFPLMFVVFFLSSINLPRDLIEVDWFRTIATWNPVSYLVEAFRSLIIVGWDWGALWRGFAVALGVLALAAAGARSALLRRMERT
ncbi:MAG TPA: ABC transporter permease [Solirubrobacteraceae bacterium]|nr:ABC transporter permease [Solirubrobacteraceae bacterium]